METGEKNIEKREKIETLEKELADLRQGLCIVQDYYHDLEQVAKAQDAEESVEKSLLKPLIAEDTEFEGIWKFHDEMVIKDPAANVPCARMFELFASYCRQKGRVVADRPSFEFMLIQMGMRRESDRELWLGCRIR